MLKNFAKPGPKIDVIDRRCFVRSAASIAGLIAGFFSGYGPGVGIPSALAQSSDAMPFERTPHFKDAYAQLLAGATPTEGKIILELPEVAENGNLVPITIAIDSPMTPVEHVKAIHILASGNPVARVATFQLTPLNGIARIQSRMRLARSQDVVVVAQLSSGEMTVATMTVKVALGGCQT